MARVMIFLVCLLLSFIVIAVTATAPSSADGFRREATGTWISGSPLSGGDGELTIVNQIGGKDAVAVLTKSGSMKPVYAVYIQDSDSVKLKHIPDNCYDLYFTQGNSWNISNNKFDDAKNAFLSDGMNEIPASLVFTTTKGQDGLYLTTTYTIYEVTLQEEGNTNMRYLSENENFPSLT